jgi:hypothetical protein
MLLDEFEVSIKVGKMLFGMWNMQQSTQQQHNNSTSMEWMFFMSLRAVCGLEVTVRLALDS